jgi:hypothetical protein
MPSATFRAHDRKAHDAWADDFERRAFGSSRIAGPGPVCAHSFVTDAVRRDPNLDNNAVQAAGEAACIARQLAEREAKESSHDRR